MGKVIQEGNDVPTTGMSGIRFDDALQEFDFVQCGFGIVRGGFDDLECDVLVDPVGAKEPKSVVRSR